MEFIFIKTSYSTFSKLYIEEIKQSLQHEAVLAVESAKNHNLQEMHIPFNTISSRFTLIDANGVVIYDSDEHKQENSLDNHLSRNEIQQAIDEGAGFSIRKSGTQNVKKAYYAIPFTDNRNQKYFFRVSDNFDKIDIKLYKILFLNIFFFLVLNLSIHLLYKNYLKKYLIVKLNRIKNFLESGSDIEEKKNFFEDDEWLTQLWIVAKKWQLENLKNLKALNDEKFLLNTVISSADMSITLIDKNFRILLKNSALNYLFENKIIDIFSSIKNIEILNLIKKFNAENLNEMAEEFYLYEYKKFFLVTLKHLPEQNQYLMLIKDITLVRELVEIQKKFISNVSHELKTPLTNIKGYLIALEDAPEELKPNFFATIYSNIDKLENSIIDFLTISKLENSNLLNLEDIFWNKIEKEIKESVASILNKKNGIIEFIYNNINSNFIKTDWEKFKLIFKNLVENGLVYNNSIIPKITISVKEESNHYLISISDNGIGIENLELDKIFERFYRVDKARTRNLAGTGLGLSIVKESIEKLHGNFSVNSEIGIGTTFTLTLPKN
ncbi:MAG: two-component sensor histidine kinase [Fusobacteriaceae bacterium]|nr:two-component sensor histidine kinase [Fusobacteriaceae bacterium]